MKAHDRTAVIAVGGGPTHRLENVEPHTQECAMASLAFDKHGKPFKLHRLARQLAVRVFSNPGGRGSCFPVRDDDGNDVFVDADADYQDFSASVKGEPGQYRLDQYDEHGEEIAGAPPAYAVIRDTRNASGAGGLDPRDAIILQLAESNSALSETNAEVSKTAIAHFAAVMHATAEILHAPVKPPAAAVSADDDKEEDDDDGDEPEPAEEDPWAAWRPILKMAEPLLPKLGELLYEQLVNLVKKSKTLPPAAATSTALAAPPTPAPTAAPSVDAAPAGVAAGSSSTTTATTEPAARNETNKSVPAAPAAARAASATNVSASAPAGHASPASTAAARSSTAPAPSTSLAIVSSGGETEPRNAALSPTPDQWEHLHAVREQLSPKERAIAENAILRMDADVLAQYLAELSAQSVDEAVATIRSMIAKLRPPRGTERGQR